MPVWYLVPDGVVQYIEKRHLYRELPRRPGAETIRHAGAQPPTDHLQEVPR
jgi:nicotinate-nucleotide adenylyltransferase